MLTLCVLICFEKKYTDIFLSILYTEMAQAADSYLREDKVLSALFDQCHVCYWSDVRILQSSTLKQKCAHFCFKVLRCGIWDMCIVGFGRLIYYATDMWKVIPIFIHDRIRGWSCKTILWYFEKIPHVSSSGVGMLFLKLTVLYRDRNMYTHLRRAWGRCRKDAT